MEINLNDQEDFTKEKVRELIRSGDNSTETQLRVTKKGFAYLSKVVGGEDIENLAFRLETWVRGNNYVGPDAARDHKWVEYVYNKMKENWPNPKSTYIDF